jgi:tetratricopeptide (TPR) repeat protein
MIKIEDEDRSRLSSLLNSAAAIRARGNLLGAASAYQKVIETGNSKYADILAIAHDNLGNVLADLGQFDDALSNYQEALGYETKPGGTRVILSNKARVLGEIGQLRLSARMQQQRVTEIENAGGGPELPIALDNAASALSKLGDHVKARQFLERAKTLLENGDPRARAINALGLSSIYATLGGLPAAGQAFRSAHDLWLAHAQRNIDIDRYRRGFVASRKKQLSSMHSAYQLYAVGVQQKNSGRWKAALSNLQQAEQFARADGDVAFALRTCANIVAVLMDAGQAGQAIELIHCVRDEASRLGLARPEMMVTATLGSLLMSGADLQDQAGPLGLFTSVVVLLDIHRKIVNELALPPEVVAFETEDSGAVVSQLARLALSHHAYDLAIDYARQSVVIALAFYQIQIEHTPPGQTPHIPFELPNRLATLLMAARSAGQTDVAEQVLTELAALLQRGGLPLRGQFVAHRVLGDQGAQQDPRAAIEHYRSAYSISEQLKQQIALGTGRADVAREHSDVFYGLARLLRIQGDTVGAFEVLQGVKARHLLEDLAARAKASSDAPPRLNEIIELLGAIGATLPTVLVDMAVEKDGLTAYLVGATGVQAVHSAADVIAGERADTGDLTERSTRLVKYCLEDPGLAGFVQAISAHLPAACRLLVCGGGFLANLPLHIVPLNGKPWCEHYSISYIPAVGALKYMAPDFSPDDAVIVAGDSRGDLPRASAECSSIAAMFRSEPLIGARCTTEAVVTRLKSAPHLLLHLAVHGRGDSRHGQRASLLLAGGEIGAGGPEWIDTRRLFPEHAKVRLVVLSGCSTAVTGPLHGFELVGIARNATKADASSVVACLWPVADAAAEKFMVTFYQNLTAQMKAGVLDLVDAFDQARVALKVWLASSARLPAGRRRDGRDLVLSQAEVMAEENDVRETLMWAPFILIGQPVLRSKQQI